MAYILYFLQNILLPSRNFNSNAFVSSNLPCLILFRNSSIRRGSFYDVLTNWYTSKIWSDHITIFQFLRMHPVPVFEMDVIRPAKLYGLCNGTTRKPGKYGYRDL